MGTVVGFIIGYSFRAFTTMTKEEKTSIYDKFKSLINKKEQ